MQVVMAEELAFQHSIHTSGATANEARHATETMYAPRLEAAASDT